MAGKKAADAKKGSIDLETLAAENRKLREENARLAEENEAAKKAAAAGPIRKASVEQVAQKYHTIKISRGPKDPRYLPVNMIGKSNDGADITYFALLERGVEIPNVPDFVVEIIKNAVETHYTAVEKQDRSGYQVEKRQADSYGYSILDTYEVKKPEAA